MKKLYVIGSLSLLAFLFLTNCDDFVDVNTPKNRISINNVFLSDETANSAISGVYSDMIANGGFASGGFYSVTLLGSLSADDFISTYSDNETKGFYNNSILPNNFIVNYYVWSEPYKFIFYANSILEGLSTTKTVTDSVSKQIEGEAKFIRAFCNFYLVNMFGGIPIVKTTDFSVNTSLTRSSKEQVYAEIKQDLLDAEMLLSEGYQFSDKRVRPNRFAAIALLARVYLYTSEWAKAEQYATKVIDNNSLYSLSDVSETFLANSTEAIWQLQPVDPMLTRESNLFILKYAPDNGVYLNPELVAEFNEDDLRYKNWIDTLKVEDKVYHFSYKYKLINDATTEYSMVLRLAEQYLIRAEARAMLDNLQLAVADLNTIRERADEDLLNDSDPAIDQRYVLSEIERERRLEFFAEWGHRWFDLKRWGSTNTPGLTRADDILLAFKGAALWQSTDVLYPIPYVQIQNDPNMANQQNPGY